MQNKTHNHRLLGAIVLLSLAVIFLPMFFGQRDDLSDTIEGSNIPRPDEELETIVFQLNNENLFQRVTPLPQAIPPVAPEPVEQGEQAMEEVQPAPVEKALEAQPAKPDELTSWMVQLGSFSKENNARALRDRLRSQQYSSYLDRRDSSNGPIWRVRVGPELSAKRAESLRQKLEQETGLKGLVIKHR